MSRVDVRQVTIITGFLGAGKTTFLNALIAYQKDRKLAVIENEFGEAGIDGELIVGADDSIYELSNGCLCCSLSDDFYSLLEMLWSRKNEFDEVVIETTGIADPAAIASPFLTIPSIGNYYQLQRVICLVDARHIEGQLQVTEEARKQISFSDIILITKTDLIEPEQLGNLKSLLKKINPLAEVLSGKKDNYPFQEIFGFERNMLPPITKRKFYLTSAAQKHDAHRHHDLVSLSFNFSEPFNLRVLEHRLMVFLNFQAKDIYRVKGIIYADEQDKRIIVQSVATDTAISTGNKWKKNEVRNSRIVFIGKDLKPEGFEKMLRNCFSSHSI
ncbi:MAG TPA: GTP-binding protein [Mucilaginibacter sp.]